MSLDVAIKFGHIICNTLVVTNDFLGLIKEKQLEDPNFIPSKELLSTNRAKDFAIDLDGMLRFISKVCVSTNDK